MRRVGLGLAIAALAVAGCGGGSKPAARPTSATPADPALRLLERVSNALSRVHSLHIAGWYVDQDGRSTVSIDIALPGRERAVLHGEQVSVELVQVDNNT